MIIYWFLYLLLSLSLSFLLTLFLKKRFLKILIFSTSFALLFTFWFKSPGENTLAPILTIFFLENTIIESNGIWRIFRPMILLFFVVFTISIIIWKKNTKN